VEQIENRSVFQTEDELMDLASTKEVLDVFSEYHDDDCAEARIKLVNDTSIQCGLNFNSQVLDPNLVLQPAAPVHTSTMGDSSEAFDVMSLF